MEISQDVERLAEQVAERREAGDPFLLFLGAGCARAAGVPSLGEIAFRVFSDYFERDPSMVEDILSPQAWAALQEEPEDGRDDEMLLGAFFELMGRMSGIARYNVLKRFYGPVPVPRFYRDVARLLVDGYFSHVLTTAIDALLEEALNDLGLQAAADYQVISLAGDPARTRYARAPNDLEADITIIKLHGDLAQLQVAISPDEIEEALKHQRAFVKGELSQDMVVVGYNMESDPVNRWLRWTTGQIWWVNAEPPPHAAMAELEERRPVRVLDGQPSRPQDFFGLLHTVLQSVSRPPDTWDESAWIDLWGEETVTVEWSSESVPTKGPPPPEELEVQYVQDQLESSRAVLASLEHRAALEGGSDPLMETQIAYQQRQIAQLEAQLRQLSYSGTGVVELIQRIRASVERAGGDPGAVSFLTEQANTVEKEYQRDQPNQDVVSAAVGATVLLANRLDPQMVDRDAVDELGAVAPGAARRGF